ncbi:MAG: PhzF family phenazine biosynthesis protein [Nitrospirae bacterium]|nr:PhzF family phenazine biosynthesis protein [Nitrospirota bacterium]
MNRELVTAYRVKVFGAQAGGGNPAVVVLDGGDLTDGDRQALATKATVPDTAFVRLDGARFAIRWFTPMTEVGLCGHATLAAARVIRETTPGSGRIEFQSAKARLIVTQEGDLSWLELPVPTNTPFDGSRNAIVEALQIWGSETELKLPLELTPERDVIIPLSEAADLQAIEPEMDQLAELGREFQVRGFCLLSRQKRDTTSNFSVRFFAPHIGIPEDPATGSVAGPLALYTLAHGWTKREPIVRLQFEQGDAVNIPCRLQVEITYEGERPVRLRVGGLTSAPTPLTL